MKKIFFILLFIFTSNTYAQNEHMKFMGISLGEKFSDFHLKLISKGLKYNEQESVIMEGTAFIYDGYFAGNNSKIIVAYDVKNKNITDVVVNMSVSSEDRMKQLYNSLKQDLKSKYINHKPLDDIQDGYPSYYLAIPQKYNNNDIIGFIYIHQQRDNGQYLGPYNVIIKYADEYNNSLKRQSNLNDL